MVGLIIETVYEIYIYIFFSLVYHVSSLLTWPPVKQTLDLRGHHV